MAAQRKQASIITDLRDIAQTHGYKVDARKQDSSKKMDDKKFLPDIIAKPYKGNGKRVFEVEVTISNNTIYKSLFSLLTALKGGASAAYLVVPKESVDFAEGCLDNVRSVLKHFSKTALGANKKIKLQILSVADVVTHQRKAKKYLQSKLGQPPKCPFLPRVK